MDRPQKLYFLTVTILLLLLVSPEAGTMEQDTSNVSIEELRIPASTGG